MEAWKPLTRYRSHMLLFNVGQRLSPGYRIASGLQEIGSSQRDLGPCECDSFSLSDTVLSLLIWQHFPCIMIDDIRRVLGIRICDRLWVWHSIVSRRGNTLSWRVLRSLEELFLPRRQHFGRNRTMCCLRYRTRRERRSYRLTKKTGDQHGPSVFLVLFNLLPPNLAECKATHDGHPGMR